MSCNGHGRRDSDELIAAALASGVSTVRLLRSPASRSRRVGAGWLIPHFAQSLPNSVRHCSMSAGEAAGRGTAGAIATLEELARSGTSEFVRLRAAREIT